MEFQQFFDIFFNEPLRVDAIGLVSYIQTFLLLMVKSLMQLETHAARKEM